ncbi:MAG: GNVR domain-containing protein [Candidatus Omnitrophica bacterium]|nr:GNVR domain-containing protein [Candidatus Omnitrophota bacterium]
MESDLIMKKKPLDYLKVVFRRKWLIIIPTVAGIIVGVLSANFLPKKYSSSTLILIEEGKVINPLFQGLAVSTSVASRLNILREQILGWDRLNQLINKLQLAKDIRSQQDFEQLVMSLRRDIQVRLRGPSIVGISYEGKNPKQSMDIVQTITDIFIAENLNQQTREADNAINFINDQLAVYKKKLKQSEVSAMEEKLKTLLTDSTDKHPVVIQLRKQIAEAKGEIDKGNYEVDATAISGGSNEELSSLKDELKKLREDLTTATVDAGKSGENRAKLSSATNEKLYKMLLLDRVEKVAAEDSNVNQKLYNELLQRLETAKITQRLEASRDGTRYIILDPARLPLRPTKPNKLYILLIGLMLGAGVGFALAFSVEMLDRSFLGVDEAKTWLDMPVLGAISKIVTHSDVTLQRARNKRIAGISAFTGVALIIIIILNFLVSS